VEKKKGEEATATTTAGFALSFPATGLPALVAAFVIIIIVVISLPLFGCSFQNVFAFLLYCILASLT
jgi:hypothetical protein